MRWNMQTFTAIPPVASAPAYLTIRPGAIREAGYTATYQASGGEHNGQTARRPLEQPASRAAARWLGQGHRHRFRLDDPGAPAAISPPADRERLRRVRDVDLVLH